MAAEKISQRANAMQNVVDARQVQVSLEAIIDGIRAVLTILDGDAGVTATNTKSTFDSYVTKS